MTIEQLNLQVRNLTLEGNHIIGLLDFSEFDENNGQLYGIEKVRLYADENIVKFHSWDGFNLIATVTSKFDRLPNYVVLEKTIY